MSIGLILKLLHVLSAIWFIGGLLGRNLVLGQARRASDVRIVETLIQVAGRFDNLMVIPGSEIVLVLGLLTAWVEGFPILGFLQGAQSNWVLVSLVLYLTTIPLVIWIFVPRGKIFDGALKAALVQGRITPELEMAFSDRAVSAAHAYELVIIAIVVILMVTKPF